MLQSSTLGTAVAHVAIRQTPSRVQKPQKAPVNSNYGIASMREHLLMAGGCWLNMVNWTWVSNVSLKSTCHRGANIVMMGTTMHWIQSQFDSWRL